MGRSRARGFTLVEVVVAAGIAVVLGWLLLHVLTQILVTSRLQAARDAEQSTVGKLVDDLTSEEDDAWAIYTPPSDVFGKSNADGHEVDFYTRDAQQRPYFWAYDYDSATRTLVRYRTGAIGGSPLQDVAFTGVTGFYAHTYPLTALQDPSTPVYSPLYNGAALQNGIVKFYAAAAPWIQGGNNITYVHITSATLRRDLQLVTNTAPTGFTVVLNYTPSPSPTPPGFKTWPANLQLATSGEHIGTSSRGQPCFAVGRNAANTSFDGSLDSNVASALGVYVDGNGCEVDANGTPLTQPVIVAWEPSGTSETFNIRGNACSVAGFGPWMPASGTGARVLLMANSTAPGACTISLSDGIATQTPEPDTGLVGINVTGVCPSGASRLGNGQQCFATMTFTPPKGCGEDGNPVILIAYSYSVTPSGAALIDPTTGIVTSSSSAPFMVTGNFKYAYEVYSRFYNGCVSRNYTTTSNWSFN